MYRTIKGRTRVSYFFLALAFVSSVVGCAVNPVTGERQLALISESQEIELGRSTAQQAEQQLGLVDDPELQAYVSDIGLRLAADSERPELPWRFAVVDDPTPNAFALPGGFIYITRGMLNLMNSEAELASVIGHEIAHVTARHSVAQLSRAQLAQVGLGLGAILYPEYRSLTNVAATGLQLLMLKYGRDAERQADELGFGYAARHNYDMTEMADVFQSLQRSGELAGRSAIPGWLASHPGEQERIEAARERAAALPPSDGNRVVGRTQYLGHLDGLVFGDNPRHGFFRDGRFLHPDMAFEFAVPEAWQKRNTNSAVLALSDSEDAKLQFTLAAGSPEQATQKFFSEQGIERGRTRREQFNSVPALVTRFRAQTQQGVVAGYVAHYEFAERTLQMLLYTPDSRFAGYDRAFRNIVASFGPLEDPVALGVEPQRIDIVRLPGSMTFREYAQQYPSSIEFDKLALINGIGDPDETLTAGTRLKRVIGDAI